MPLDGSFSGFFVTKYIFTLYNDYPPRFHIGRFGPSDFICNCTYCEFNCNSAVKWKTDQNKFIPKMICRRKLRQYDFEIDYDHISKVICNFEVEKFSPLGLYLCQRIPRRYSEKFENECLYHDRHYMKFDYVPGRGTQYICDSCTDIHPRIKEEDIIIMLHTKPDHLMELDIEIQHVEEKSESEIVSSDELTLGFTDITRPYAMYQVKRLWKLRGKRHRYSNINLFVNCLITEFKAIKDVRRNIIHCLSSEYGENGLPPNILGIEEGKL